MIESETAFQYELTLTPDEARQGSQKILTRNSKKLQVKIPSGVVTGSHVRLSNALQSTDGKPGDIIIVIKVKTERPISSTEAYAGVVNITNGSFNEEVLQSALPVVVDFWAPWCGPCRMMSPVMERVAEQYKGKFKFCKLNVDEDTQTASQYQASSIPTLLFFRNGQLIDRSVGAIPENQLKEKIEALLK